MKVEIIVSTPDEHEARVRGDLRALLDRRMELTTKMMGAMFGVAPEMVTVRSAHRWGFAVDFVPWKATIA